jgi:hypothetical protein
MALLFARTAALSPFAPTDLTESVAATDHTIKPSEND